ncbi:MAG: AAA family ATPase [Anaerolineaceae bacterium]|nr:AAA family ATPase [Anaerolineaceae bacterium]
MSTLDICLFGTLTIIANEKNLPLPASIPARKLLVYLLLFASRSHTRNKLIGIFWPDLSEDRARKALSQAIWHIRRIYTDLVISKGETIGLSPEIEISIDTQTFIQLTQPWINITPLPAEGKTTLMDAVNLYHGDLLEGYYEDWILIEREEFRIQYHQTLEKLLQVEKSSENYSLALDYGLKLLQFDPLQESIHQEIMRLYYLLGRPEAALHQFESCCQILRTELELEPEPETIELAKEITRRSQLETSPYLPEPPVNNFTHSGPIVTPLIGRKNERIRLLQHINNAIEKRGGVVLLEGEAGIGKSRLLNEIARDAEWRGAQVLWGWARESFERQPFVPILEALNTGLSELRIVQIQETINKLWFQILAPLLPILASNIDDLKPAPVLDAAHEQARLIEALANFLRSWAVITPLVLILEDLHWADQDTLSLLPVLGRRLQNEGVLLICVFRGEEVRANSETWEAIQTLDRDSQADRLILSRLDEESTRELIRCALNLPQPAPLFEGRIFRETDGNPLFVVETLRALQDEGLLSKDNFGGWSTPWDDKTNDYTELPLPSKVESVILRRLEQIPQNARGVLRLAAILGQQFTFRLLCQACRLDLQSLLENIHQIVTRGFLEEISDGYRFSHDKIFQVVRKEIKPDERIHLNQRAVEAIESISPDQVEILAYHCQNAKLWEKSIRYYMKSGKHAAAAHAYEATRKYYDTAIILADKYVPNESSTFDLLSGKERALDILGERQEQFDALNAMELLIQNDPKKTTYVNLRRAWYLMQTNQFEEAKKIAYDAFQSGAELKDIEIQTEAHFIEGTILTWQGRTEESILPLIQAVNIVKAHENRHNETKYRRSLASSYLGIREYDKAKEQLDIAIIQAEKMNHILEQAEIFNLLGIFYMERGESENGIHAYNQSLEKSRMAGYIYGEGRALVNLGNLYYFKGQLSETLKLYDQAINVFGSLTEKRGEVQLRLNRASISLSILGNSPQVKKDAHFAMDYAKIVDDPISLGQSLTVLAEANRHEGNLIEAQNLMKEGIEAIKIAGDDWLLVQEYRTLGYLSIEEGKYTDALDILDQALEICNRLQLESMYPPIIAIRGLALLGMKKTKEALLATSEALKELKPDVEQSYLLYYWHALCLQASGCSEEVRPVIQKAYELMIESLKGLSEEQINYSLQFIPEHQAIVKLNTEIAPKTITIELPRVNDGNETVNVTWTIFDNKDDLITNKVDRRKQCLKRLIHETDEQGAVATYQQYAKAMQVGVRTIERDIAAMKRGGEENGGSFS